MRDDVLRELKLAPRWVRKAAVVEAPGQQPMTPAFPPAERAAADHASVTGTTTSAIASASASATLPEDVAARLAHIAALSLGELGADIEACKACRLYCTRKRSVPGVGDPDADWLFVGEAPGAEEDAQGKPFVGQSGRLLDNMLAALGLSRARQVYIANVLKCRPPNNRAPEPAEASACEPYLLRQIELVAPRIIVALGKSAATLLLGEEASIASLRGRVHRYRGLPLVVTYHPAYLLRSLPDKAKAWEDLLLAKRTLAGV